MCRGSTKWECCCVGWLLSSGEENWPEHKLCLCCYAFKHCQRNLESSLKSPLPSPSDATLLAALWATSVEVSSKLPLPYLLFMVIYFSATLKSAGLLCSLHASMNMQYLKAGSYMQVESGCNIILFSIKS